jgi:hypothetical protein
MGITPHGATPQMPIQPSSAMSPIGVVGVVVASQAPTVQRSR